MRGRGRLASVGALAVTAALAPAGAALADESPPANLGNGLGRLVQPPRVHGAFKFDQARLAIRDKAGRVLVNVYAKPGTSMASLREHSEDSGLKVTTQTRARKTLEGFVAVSRVKALARATGVASVSQVLRPHTNVGAATSQGVHAERVDRIGGGIDGRGITVGAMSDSFDTATETVDGDPLTIHAAQDIKSGDLPKDGVTVIEDSDGGEDEGRAMLQLVHDIAPRAKECFATAFTSQEGFAANIRALADKNGPCGADVITDDVGILDEPFFGQSPISDAIDDVAAQGVSYFSSSGNGSSQQAYAAPLRIVGPDKAGDRSNIDLSGVPPDLYAGGFHDFDAGPGVDVAQDVSVGGPASGKDGSATLDLQWDDPIDPNGAPLGPAKIDTTGEITAAAPVASIPFQAAAGETVKAVADGIPSGSTDLILSLVAPDGTVLQEIDTDTSPETLVQRFPTAGTYTFRVSGFEGDTGDFTFTLADVLSNSRTSTDLNVLFFDADGQFLAASSDLNQISGKPFEITGFNFSGPLQIVIAKANADGGNATRVRYQMYDDLQENEYVDPLAPSIYGHPLAQGANAVAAYDPFRPFLPEDYTSVGGDLPILFDSQGNPLARPIVRRTPDMAATDGGNTTFFVRDNIADPDDLPNFFGTSAAAPHAAGIAALVQQARGGSRSVPTSAMRSILQRSAFPHDLDQEHSGASGGGLTITADGEQGFERSVSRPRDETGNSMIDPQFFKVSYSGPGSIVSLTLDGARASPTGLGRRDDDRSNGLVFDPRPFLGLPSLGGPDLYEQGFPFTVGAASEGIDPSAITASFARPGVGQATAQQFQEMTVHFPDGALGQGRQVAFGVDRDEATTAWGDAQDGNSADALGAGVLFPEGTVAFGGLTYRAVTSTGGVLTGTLRNRIGQGWTPVDGFGFINAEAAVGRRHSHR